ncbi:MAG: LOW QUALITY PROTEIN: hypothetical protein J3Q66DRAFT_320955 [Benniella sp.]|nr:MAG: LOW QUALITY PROTEIN: hypothetical protein J3Q66DRAFT_320955 [Benniella sp.]
MDYPSKSSLEILSSPRLPKGGLNPSAVHKGPTVRPQESGNSFRFASKILLQPEQCPDSSDQPTDVTPNRNLPKCIGGTVTNNEYRVRQRVLHRGACVLETGNKELDVARKGKELDTVRRSKEQDAARRSKGLDVARKKQRTWTRTSPTNSGPSWTMPTNEEPPPPATAARTMATDNDYRGDFNSELFGKLFSRLHLGGGCQGPFPRTQQDAPPPLPPRLMTGWMKSNSGSRQTTMAFQFH